jgi:hypothetical protein
MSSKAQKKRAADLRRQIEKMNQPRVSPAFETPGQFVQRRMAELAKANKAVNKQSRKS